MLTTYIETHCGLDYTSNKSFHLFHNVLNIDIVTDVASHDPVLGALVGQISDKTACRFSVQT